MAIIPVVQWSNALPNVFAWKFPGNELTTKSQLIVSESQEAVFFKEGQAVGVFGPGRHTLDTKNYPFLTKLVTTLVSGGESPFTAEVWFVQKSVPLNLKWGTTDPIQVEDPKYDVMLPVRAFGQYGIQVVDSQKFLCKMVGRIPAFTERTITEYFRGIIVTRCKDSIAKQMLQHEICLLHISSHLSDISDCLNSLLGEELDSYGLRICNFMVNSISVPENDPTVIKLRDAMAKRAEMQIVGYTYEQERSFGVMDKAAANEGNGNLMNAGIGLGMGVGMGSPVGKAMSGIGQKIQTENPSEPEKICKKCNTKVKASMAFCPNCGSKVEDEAPKKEDDIVCDKCGAHSPKGAKFCSNCGDIFYLCPVCGCDNDQSAKNCSKCGNPLPQKCPNCGSMIPGNCKFCQECGTKLVKVCSKCGKELTDGMKFCAECGNKID